MDTNKVEEAAVDHCPKGDPKANLGHCADSYEFVRTGFFADTENPCYNCSYGKLASEHLKKVNAAKLRDEV